jgi:hypothetical protein
VRIDRAGRPCHCDRRHTGLSVHKVPIFRGLA